MYNSVRDCNKYALKESNICLQIKYFYVFNEGTKQFLTGERENY